MEKKPLSPAGPAVWPPAQGWQEDVATFDGKGESCSSGQGFCGEQQQERQGGLVGPNLPTVDFGLKQERLGVCEEVDKVKGFGLEAH